jgi:hypothetical protein
LERFGIVIVIWSLPGHVIWLYRVFSAFTLKTCRFYQNNAGQTRAKKLRGLNTLYGISETTQQRKGVSMRLLELCNGKRRVLAAASTDFVGLIYKPTYNQLAPA